MMMQSRGWLRAVVCAALVLAASAAGADEDARGLVKRVLDAIPATPFTARMKLTSDRGWVRELELSHKRVDEVDNAYMEVTSPMDLKDTRFLLIDRVVGRDEQFIYVPTLKRAIQVSTETRKQPFLGSDFYVYDMVRPEFDAYTYSFVGEEDVNGRHCKLVESVPKNSENDLYSKTILSIDPTDVLVMRTKFFDPQGKLLKVWTIDKIEKVDGNWTPLQQTMEQMQDKHTSHIELLEVKYNANLSDEIFRRAHLTR